MCAWFERPALAFILVLVTHAVLRLFGTYFRFKADAIADKNPELVLETIGASHFVEATRWAMDRLQVPYTEHECIGVLGILLTSRRVPRLHLTSSRTEISDSYNIFRFLYGRYQHLGEIASFLEPVKEEDRELEEAVRRFGYHVRRWAYHAALVASGKQKHDIALRIWGAYQPNIPQWQRALLRMVEPLLIRAVILLVKVNDKSRQRSLQIMEESFDLIDARLRDGRRYLLGTESLTYVDIMWASYCGLLFFPPNYSGGQIAQASRISVEEYNERALQESKRFMARPAGALAQRLYAEERMSTKKSN